MGVAIFFMIAAAIVVWDKQSRPARGMAFAKVHPVALERDCQAAWKAF